MGGVKAEGIRFDGLVHRALGIAVKAGSISINCPHETAIDLMDEEPAYDLAHEMFARGELTEFKNIDELDQALKQAFDDAGTECSACLKYGQE